MKSELRQVFDGTSALQNTNHLELHMVFLDRRTPAHHSTTHYNHNIIMTMTQQDDDDSDNDCDENNYKVANEEDDCSYSLIIE